MQQMSLLPAAPPQINTCLHESKTVELQDAPYVIGGGMSSWIIRTAGPPNNISTLYIESKYQETRRAMVNF